jgi:hypothetical protein
MASRLNLRVLRGVRARVSVSACRGACVAHSCVRLLSGSADAGSSQVGAPPPEGAAPAPPPPVRALPPPYESDEFFATMRPRHVFGWITGNDVSPTIWMGPVPDARGFGCVVVVPTLETLAPYRSLDLFRAWSTAFAACYSVADGALHPSRELMCTPSLVALACMRPEAYVWAHEGAPAWAGYNLLGPPAAHDPSSPPHCVKATIDDDYFPIVGLSGQLAAELPSYAALAAAFTLPLPPVPPPAAEFEPVTPARVKGASHELYATQALAAASAEGANFNSPAGSLAEFYTRMLAAAHPRLVAPSPLHAFAEAFGLNQLLSVEYVDALAAYLKARLAALGAPGGPVAEVGAGMGVLAAALRQRGVPLVASSTNAKWPRPFLGAEALVPRGVVEED